MIENDDFFYPEECLGSGGPLNNFYLIFFDVLRCKSLLFFMIRKKMSTRGRLVAGNNLGFPLGIFFHLKDNIQL